MKKLIFFIALTIYSELIFSCPSCVGSMNDPKSGNIVPILAGFIVLTYIPFYFIYKMIIKNQNFNQTYSQEIKGERESK